MDFEDAMRSYLRSLAADKPVIYCGDLNVAHQEIDLRHPAANRFNPGFSDQERAKMTELLGAGFTDTFRHLYPDRRDAYSWWSYRSNARANNTGWRIDYFLVSSGLDEKIKAATIQSQVYGSDHCPVTLEIDL
jgi:exodeoxyribonuclease-3